MRGRSSLWTGLLLIFITACTQPGLDISQEESQPTQTEGSLKISEQYPSESISPTLPQNPVRTDSPTVSPESGGLSSAAPSASPEIVSIPSTMPPSTPAKIPQYFPFQYPIRHSDEFQTRIDMSYRFGTTQDGLRDPHHGIELQASFGTPIYAAADGLVIFAGTDDSTEYGPYPNYYGNFIILEHNIPLTYPGYTQPSPPRSYTIYAHLSEISIKEDQRVALGDRIGAVGFSGAATGSHLHIEVRSDPKDYATSRNPELWIAQRLDDRQLLGAVSGMILDPLGDPLPLENLVLSFQEGLENHYFSIYEEVSLIDQQPFHESFGIGGLKPGIYHLSFVHRGLNDFEITILPGEISQFFYQFKD